MNQNDKNTLVRTERGNLMTLNENKKKTLIRTGGTLAVITSVALNLITVLDWLGISPKDARNTQYVQAVQEVSPVEYAPLTQTVDYGFQEDVIEEAVFIPDDDYIIVQEEAIPMEEYYIPADEAVPAEGYAIPQNSPVILNAVQLTDMHVSDASDIDGGFALRSSGMDITGKVYSPVLLTDTPVLLTPEQEFLRYNQYELNNGYYHTFAGTVFLTADYASTSGYAYFDIYGDGALLESYVFTGGDLPVDFEVDITGVEVLEIRSVTSTDISPVIGLANAYLAYY